jgi:hypothetical protein
MVTLRITADVPNNRQLLITLPPEVPTGQTDLEIRVAPRSQNPLSPRGVPAADIIGIGVGMGTPPADETVREWIQEHRMGKYG